MTAWSRADEGPHEPGSAEWWEESWDLQFVAPDSELGGFVRLARLPNQRRLWCWVYVLRDDGTVVVRDHDVPLLTKHPLLARAEGLWCELVCELPLFHWSIGVEAFGVRLDDPCDGVRGEIGERLPVGLELEWEAPAPRAYDLANRTGYYQTGRVHGDVLLGEEVIAFDGDGVWSHAWGERNWSTSLEEAWFVWADGQRSMHWRGAPAVVTPRFDAVIPLTATGEQGPVLTRSLVEAVDPRGIAGHGMRTVVRAGTD